MNMRIKKGDNVVILAGKSRGMKGTVERVFKTAGRLLVEGANLAKRRRRPRKQGEKGQVVEMALPIDLSNVALWCPKCGRGVRIGHQLADGKKTRVCRRCRQVI